MFWMWVLVRETMYRHSPLFCRVPLHRWWWCTKGLHSDAGYLSFLVCVFGVISKKSLPNSTVWGFSSILRFYFSLLGVLLGTANTVHFTLFPSYEVLRTAAVLNSLSTYMRLLSYVNYIRPYKIPLFLFYIVLVDLYILFFNLSASLTFHLKCFLLSRKHSSIFFTTMGLLSKLS